MLPLGRTLQALAGAGFLLAAGCAPTPAAGGPGAGGVENAQAGGSGTRPDQPSISTTRLLERIQLSPEHTRYSGLRLLEFHLEDQGVPNLLSYHEEVACDGEGNFTIDTVDVLSGSDDAELFRILQNNRQIFTFNYRDFRITDRALLLLNYSIRHEANSVAVAGLPCSQLRVDRLASSDRYYRIWVEPETGLVLRWEQRTTAETLIGRMEFESIDLDPDLSNHLLVKQQFGGRALDIDKDLAQQVGFELLTPVLLPSGYELESARVVDDEYGSWLRRVYTDGVGRMALLHREHQELTGPQDEGHLGQVQWMQVGPWNVVMGTLEGWGLIVMGQLDPDEIFQMLQSAF